MHQDTFISKSRTRAHASAIAARSAVVVPATLHADYLNTAPSFWTIYWMAPGAARREALLRLFRLYPRAILPVNNHYQANMLDPDLARLVKQGVLMQKRSGGFGSVMNRSSAKRQSYLQIASTAESTQT